MPQTITSKNHGIARLVRRLRKKSYRDETGLFAVEGLNVIREAAGSGTGFSEIVFVEDHAELVGLLQRELREPADQYLISESLMSRISDVVTPQGVIAVAEHVDVHFEEILAGRPDMVLVACGVRDPGNMGALIRIADAAEMGGVIATENSVDIYNPKVLRAAAGSHFHVTLSRNASADDLFAALAESGFTILGLEAHGEEDYLDTGMDVPTAFVVGNEAYGFSEREKEFIHRTVFIDMPGRAESLNVASAAAVVVFEALRQRRISSGGSQV